MDRRLFHKTAAAAAATAFGVSSASANEAAADIRRFFPSGNIDPKVQEHYHDEGMEIIKGGNVPTVSDITAFSVENDQGLEVVCYLGAEDHTANEAETALFIREDHLLPNSLNTIDIEALVRDTTHPNYKTISKIGEAQRPYKFLGGRGVWPNARQLYNAWCNNERSLCHSQGGITERALEGHDVLNYMPPEAAADLERMLRTIDGPQSYWNIIKQTQCMTHEDVEAYKIDQLRQMMEQYPHLTKFFLGRDEGLAKKGAEYIEERLKMEPTSKGFTSELMFVGYHHKQGVLAYFAEHFKDRNFKLLTDKSTPSNGVAQVIDQQLKLGDAAHLPSNLPPGTREAIETAQFQPGKLWVPNQYASIVGDGVRLV